MQPKETRSKNTEENTGIIPDPQTDTEIVEPTPPQDHQPSITDSQIDRELSS